MKKKILILSLFVNLIASVFVFMAFKEKSKNKAENGGYIIMAVSGEAGKIFISDGNSTFDETKLRYPWSGKGVRENNQTVAKKLNDLISKGYELVSSNGDRYGINYILEKKQ